ncbi:MAG: HAD-IA family hydrolase [Candidatus Babeliales bacterium]
MEYRKYGMICLLWISCLVFGLYNDFPAVSAQTSPTTTIIFDLDGVIFTIPRYDAFRYLGLVNSVKLFFLWGGSTSITQKMFTLLDLITLPLQEEALLANNKQQPSTTYNGFSLPYIMQEWLCGTYSTEFVLSFCIEKIELVEKTELSKQEKKLFIKMLHLFFDPAIRASLYKPIPEGIALLKHCKKLNYQIFLLSNNDTALVTLLQEKYPEIFSLFDQLIISEEVKLAKPDPAIFEYVLNHYHLDPTKTYFFDDQDINVQAASETGIAAFTFNKSNTENVSHVPLSA